MYVMQQSYINTVGNALHINDMKTGVTKSFFISGGVLLLSLILMSTDGSFRQSRYFLGFVMFLPSVIAYVVQHVKQAKFTKQINSLELTTNTMKTNAILTSAKQFNRVNGIIRGIMYAWMFVCMGTAVVDTANSLVLYCMSGVAGLLLVVLSLMHIFFQTKIAHNKPPQFSKKGAAYDEN